MRRKRDGSVSIGDIFSDLGDGPLKKTLRPCASSYQARG